MHIPSRHASLLVSPHEPLPTHHILLHRLFSFLPSLQQPASAGTGYIRLLSTLNILYFSRPPEQLSKHLPASSDLRIGSQLTRLCDFRARLASLDMRSSSLALGLLATLLPTTLSQSTPAPIVTGNPRGAQYIATLPNNASLPNGTFIISSTSDGNGVYVQVNVSNLPASGGPFCEFHTGPLPTYTQGS